MAEIAPFPTREAAPLGHVEVVSVDRIDVVDRLRPVDPDWATALADDIGKRGLGTPLAVRHLPGRGPRLVFGAHRLAAVKLLGWSEVEVRAFRGTAEEARAWEIAENLVRRELGALDRAAFTAELYELERKRVGWEDGRSAHAAAADRRWAKDASANMAKASELDEAVAAKVGLSARSIQRQLELFRGLDARVRAALAGLPVAENGAQLRLLARQPAATQLRIVEQLRAGDVQSVAQGVALASPSAAADPAKKRYATMLATWSRMSLHERKLLLRDLPLPAGVTLAFGGRA